MKPSAGARSVRLITARPVPSTAPNPDALPNTTYASPASVPPSSPFFAPTIRSAKPSPFTSPADRAGKPSPVPAPPRRDAKAGQVARRVALDDKALRRLQDGEVEPRGERDCHRLGNPHLGIAVDIAVVGNTAVEDRAGIGPL